MADPIDVVSLAEAKTFLNIAVPDNDTELATFITAASSMWIRRVGPVASGTTFDEWYDGGNVRIALNNIPVATVTKVEESISATGLYTLTEQTLQSGGDTGAWGYSIDKTSGVLVRRASGVATAFAAGTKNIHVVYTTGYASIPEDIKLAVKLIVSHMWETQRGQTKRPGSGGQDWNPGMGYTWPNRAEEIARTYQIPGIA